MLVNKISKPESNRVRPLGVRLLIVTPVQCPHFLRIYMYIAIWLYHTPDIILSQRPMHE